MAKRRHIVILVGATLALTAAFRDRTVSQMRTV
jgi:hypothetical protein